jgi:hypothetical protein
MVEYQHRRDAASPRFQWPKFGLDSIAFQMTTDARRSTTPNSPFCLAGGWAAVSSRRPKPVGRGARLTWCVPP